MKFIRPTKITDAMLVSSTVPENDYPLWVGSGDYSVGTLVRRAETHRVYENLIPGVNAQTPESTLANASPRWLEVAPTNRWAMFDAQIGTATTASNSLTVVLSPGRINSLALLEVDAAIVDVTLTVSGVVEFSASMNLTSGNSVGDWYQYFYEPVYQQDTVVITDLVDASLLDIPAYAGGILTVTLSRPGGTVSCGVMVVGLYASLGTTQYSPSIGITDWSRKENDAFGNPIVVKRKYSKRMSANVAVLSEEVDRVARVLAQYRSTPVVWVGAGSIYTSMVIFGFYKDWDMTVDNYSEAALSLQVEGMV